jgi:hypothetical protein
MNILNMLRGISGEFEVNRVIGAAGAATYIVSTPLFVAWEILYNHRPFDMIAWCAAYPGGLGIAVGAIAGAVAIKDRNVATATVVKETGAQPGAAAPVGPQDVNVVNRPSQPVPVEQTQ